MPTRAPLFQRVLLISLVTLALAARLLPGARTIDDSFITYRYARNILAGNGFVYNPGERVLGTTTPFYTLLLTGIALFNDGPQADFPQISLILNALADAAVCLLLLHTGRRLGARWAGWGAAFTWAFAPFSVTFAVGGLETSVFVLLLTGTIAAYLDRRFSLTALLAALCLLTRPDALIFLGPLALDRILRSGARWIPARLTRISTAGSPAAPITLRESLLFIVPTLLWFGFATLYFGSPLPHSVAAKTLAYRLDPEAAFVRLLQHYATPFLDNLTFGSAGIMAGFVLYPFLFLLGSSQAIRRQVHAWPWLAYPLLYFAAFSIANPLIFRWYLTPPLPPYILGIMMGIEVVLGSIFIRKKEAEKSVSLSPLHSSVAVLLVVLVPLLLNLRGWVLSPDHGLTRPAPDMAWYKLELLYHQAAELLNPALSQLEQPVLAAGDVGALGYDTTAKILDTVGLNSAQSLRYFPLDAKYYAINYAVPPDLILDEQPDFIVLLEAYGRLGLFIDPRFQAAYRLREKIPTDIYGSDGMLIFEKVTGR